MKYQREHLKEVLFPLGGIGSGSISIAGNGVLRDWEIMGRPAKGSWNGPTHFAIRLKDSKGNVYTRVIVGDEQKDFMGHYTKSIYNGYGFGIVQHRMCGFPHFENCRLTGEFPFATFEFSDKNFPGKIELTAWNPFIPLDDKNSSIPGAFFDIKYINDTDEDMEVMFCFLVWSPFDKSLNSISDTGKFKLIHFKSTKPSDVIGYGDMSVICDADGAFAQQSTYRGVSADSIISYWNELTAGHFSDRRYDTPGEDGAVIGRKINVVKNSAGSAKFILTWNVPNCYNYWKPYKDENGNDILWKNYYATLFEDSIASAIHSAENYDIFYEKTLNYKNAMFEMSLPEEVIEAAASTVSVIKSPTVLRLENGEFYGFEGVNEQGGSCEGTCQHVWNYTYALCFLFPSLERSIRDLEFKYLTEDNGYMHQRIELPLGRKQTKFIPCFDGQMGAVIKTYREWKISGNTEWLKKHWGNVKKVLEFAWNPENECKWDENKSGVASGRMHHTLDMEMFSPNAWLQGFYLAALRAAAEMAEFLGEKDKAAEYTEIFEKGYKWTDENLFNGKYFIQKIDLTDKSLVDKFDCSNAAFGASYWNEETGEIKYQIGEGCEIDQLCGQWHANILGLGKLFDNEKIKIAAESMYKNNFKKSMREYVNTFRIFALNDESGAIMCDYPEGSYRPRIPILYYSESMHGFEYQLAGTLAAAGYFDEAFEIVKSVRARYNGKNRNPYNEIECGGHYARSMASFALIPILSGFIFDMPHNKIGFDPKINKDNFKSIWSLEGGWGVFEKNGFTNKISVRDGEISLSCIELPYMQSVNSLKLDGIDTPFEFKNGEIKFEKTLIKERIEIK